MGCDLYKLGNILTDHFGPFGMLRDKRGLSVCLFVLGTAVCLCFKVCMINIMVIATQRQLYLPTYNS